MNGARAKLIGLLKAWERDRLIDRPPDAGSMRAIVEVCAEVADEECDNDGRGCPAPDAIRACLKEAGDAR